MDLAGITPNLLKTSFPNWRFSAWILCNC